MIFFFFFFTQCPFATVLIVSVPEWVCNLKRSFHSEGQIGSSGAVEFFNFVQRSITLSVCQVFEKLPGNPTDGTKNPYCCSPAIITPIACITVEMYAVEV